MRRWAPHLVGSAILLALVAPADAQPSQEELLASVRETLWPSSPHQFEAFAVRAEDWDTNATRSTPPRVPGMRLEHRLAPGGLAFVKQDTFRRQRDGSIVRGIGKQMGWNGQQAVFTQTDPSLLDSGLAQIAGFDDGQFDGYSSLATLSPSTVFSGFIHNYGRTIADLAETLHWSEVPEAEPGERVLTATAEIGTVRLLFRDGRISGWDISAVEGDLYGGETLPIRWEDAHGEGIMRARREVVRFIQYRETTLGPALPTAATVQLVSVSNSGESTRTSYTWRRDVRPLTGPLNQEFFTPTGIHEGQRVLRNRLPSTEGGATPPPALVWYGGRVVEDTGQVLADRADQTVPAERERTAAALGAAPGWSWQLWTLLALAGVVVVLLLALLVVRYRRGTSGCP